MTLFMVLHNRFELVRASLLHRHHLPTLDVAVTALDFEETRLGPNTKNSVEVLTVTKKPLNNKFEKSSNECLYCHETSHTVLYCPKRICKFCRKHGPKHYSSDY